MNNKIFLSTLVAWSISLGACAQTESWNGTYEYEALLGENAAEDQVIIEYSFFLSENKCQVTSQGYQTDEKILCYTEEKSNQLDVKFKSFADGAVENVYGVQIYPPKSTLFKLVRSDGKITTTWGTLSPDDSLSTGVYFVKQEP